MNEQFLIADFNMGDQRRRVYLLNPGDMFERFGGSSSGLLVRKTASLIVSDSGPMGTHDREYDINRRDVWDSIFRLARKVGYEPNAV